jgi:GTPase
MPRRRSEVLGAAAEELADLPVVALVGRPNVGKSSLFNRLVGGRPALVEDKPGVTRDRRYGVCSWRGRSFRIVDTGGLDPSADGILGAMRAQTMRAVEEGKALVFVLDAAAGITAVDQDVARLLRKTGKPVLIAANKVDSASREGAAAELFRLGLGEVYPVSAAHGRGVGELLDVVLEALGDTAPRERLAAPEEDDTEETPDAVAPDRPIRLAFAGKPNVGKSSLVNRLLGEERVLVHDQPGTTRDPIDTPFRAEGREFVLVDTAGLRRRRAVDTFTEAISAKMTRDQLARADVVALVVDLAQGASAEDAKLASFVEESGRAAILVLNKADLVPRKDLDARVAASREQLAFMSYAPVVLTSALTGKGLEKIPGAVARVFEQWSRRVSTADLNKHFEAMVTKRPPPAGPSGRHVRLYYATQADVCPPVFYISSNLPAAVGFPYRRYLLNQLREIYGFEGAPLKVVLRKHKSKGREGGEGA